MKMIKVIVREEGVSEFETLSEALDEVLDFSNVTMIDTHTKTTYVYDEDATLCFEHQFEDTADVNPFTKEEMEIVRSALEFASNNAEGLTKMVIENIIDKI